jgi:hypothetical protein
MIPDRDIWRAANLLIREHAAEAEIVAARRADEMLGRGDRDGQLVCYLLNPARCFSAFSSTQISVSATSQVIVTVESW